MTNKDAIRALKILASGIELRGYNNTWLDYFRKSYEMAINALEDSSWIPVTEKLPDKKGYFLTSTVFNEVYCDFWNGEGFERTDMILILAWMPLPNPYKKEDK